MFLPGDGVDNFCVSRSTQEWVGRLAAHLEKASLDPTASSRPAVNVRLPPPTWLRTRCFRCLCQGHRAYSHFCRTPNFVAPMYCSIACPLVKSAHRMCSSSLCCLCKSGWRRRPNCFALSFRLPCASWECFGESGGRPRQTKSCASNLFDARASEWVFSWEEASFYCHFSLLLHHVRRRGMCC